MLPGSEIILPPQSREAEESLVGAIMINPHGIDELGFIEPEDFYFNTNRVIFRSMREMIATKMPIDFLTLSEHMNKTGVLEEVGGPAGLSSLLSNVPMSFNVGAYAAIVKDKAQRRALLEKAGELAKIAYDETKPTAEPVTKVMEGIVNSVQSSDKTARHISEGLRDLVEFTEMRMQDPREVWGVPTGFKDLDAFTGGLHSGLVFYIAGEPSIGKTKIAIQMAIQAALPENGSHPVAIYTFEMPEIEIVKRAVSTRSHITTYAMNSGIIPDDVLGEYLDDVAYMERLPIYISDKPMNPGELHADLLIQKRKNGVELAVIDYLILMQGYEDMDETPRSAMLSRALKNVFHGVGIAGLAVSSTTKEIISSTALPTMKDMRGSAQVLFNADAIAFLTQEQTNPDLANLIFTKMPRTVNRNIGKSTIVLRKDYKYPIFHDAEVTVLDLKRFE